MIEKLLYLGPSGSYSEMAKSNFAEYFSSDCEFVPVDSIYNILRKLSESESNYLGAVVPIENSIEGVVRETQDNLYRLVEKGFRIFSETNLSIEHSLISFGEMSDIKVIKSHPQALAQCREYIYKNWKEDVVLTPVLSTSNAVSGLNIQEPSVAAIGNSNCANLYKVPVLEYKINDEKNNTTRFVLLSKATPIKSNMNKVSITFSTENKPGALNRVLQILERYNINMSYIDSRPSKRLLGEYIFYVDFLGHINDSNVTLALTEIQPYVSLFEILSEGAICI